MSPSLQSVPFPGAAAPWVPGTALLLSGPFLPGREGQSCTAAPLFPDAALPSAALLHVVRHVPASPKQRAALLTLERNEGWRCVLLRAVGAPCVCREEGDIMEHTHSGYSSLLLRVQVGLSKSLSALLSLG